MPKIFSFTVLSTSFSLLSTFGLSHSFSDSVHSWRPKFLWFSLQLSSPYLVLYASTAALGFVVLSFLRMSVSGIIYLGIGLFILFVKIKILGLPPPAWTFRIGLVWAFKFFFFFFFWGYRYYYIRLDIICFVFFFFGGSY